MLTLDRYLIRKLFIACAINMFLIIGLLWLIVAMRYFELLSQTNMSIVMFVKLITLGMFNSTTILFALSCLFATLMVGYQLHNDREIAAMESIGASRWQIVKPFMMFAFFMFAIANYNNHFLVPQYKKEFTQLRNQIKHEYLGLWLEQGVFNHKQLKGRTLYIDERVDYNSVRGIFIHDTTDNKHAVTLTAESALIQDTSEGPIFILQNGTHHLQDLVKNITTISQFKAFTLSLPHHGKSPYQSDNDIAAINSYQLLIANKFVNSYNVIWQRFLWAFNCIANILLVIIPIVLQHYERKQKLKTQLKPLFIGSINIMALSMVINMNNLQYTTTAPLIYFIFNILFMIFYLRKL